MKRPLQSRPARLESFLHCALEPRLPQVAVTGRSGDSRYTELDGITFSLDSGWDSVILSRYSLLNLHPAWIHFTTHLRFPRFASTFAAVASLRTSMAGLLFSGALLMIELSCAVLLSKAQPLPAETLWAEFSAMQRRSVLLDLPALLIRLAAGTTWRFALMAPLWW